MINLTPQQAHELMAHGEVEVIDVREPHEWAEGHLPCARHLPLGIVRAGARSHLQRDGVVFVCAAGIRSQAAARIAEGLGLKRVYNLTGGTQSWVRAGLPLVVTETRQAS